MFAIQLKLLLYGYCSEHKGLKHWFRKEERAKISVFELSFILFKYVLFYSRVLSGIT